MGILKRLFGKKDHAASPLPPAPVSAERATSPQPAKPVPVSQRTSVWRDEYLEGDAEKVALDRREGDLPHLRLIRERGRLVLEAPGVGWISPKSRSLHRTGILMFGARGTAYHEAAFKRADLPLGRVLRLVREPENEHDLNAIAIYADRARTPLGYVNKQNAARLSKRMDAGEAIVCIVAKGGPAGDGNKPCALLATDERTLDHITRDLRG